MGSHFIKRWRKYRRLSQEQLAERIDSTASTISQLENGKQGYTETTLQALAVALSTDAASLLARDPLDPEGLWSVWEKIPARERAKAIEILKVLAAAPSKEREAKV